MLSSMGKVTSFVSSRPSWIVSAGNATMCACLTTRISVTQSTEAPFVSNPKRAGGPYGARAK